MTNDDYNSPLRMLQRLLNLFLRLRIVLALEVPDAADPVAEQGAGGPHGGVVERKRPRELRQEPADDAERRIAAGHPRDQVPGESEDERPEEEPRARADREQA